jgi:hypothetical protein
MKFLTFLSWVLYGTAFLSVSLTLGGLSIEPQKFTIAEIITSVSLSLFLCMLGIMIKLEQIKMLIIKQGKADFLKQK